MQGLVGMAANGAADKASPFCQGELRRRASYQQTTATIFHQIGFSSSSFPVSRSLFLLATIPTCLSIAPAHTPNF